MVRIVARYRVGAGSAVEVRDDFGLPRRVEFPTNQAPSDAEIVAALQAQEPPEIVGTTRAQIEPSLVARYQEWRRWHDTHAEAVARSLAAAVVTALLTRRDDAWTAYVGALNTWRAAPP